MPAPIYNYNFSDEINVKVLNTIRNFNNTLKKKINHDGHKLVDIFRFTAGKDGYSNKRFHIDDYHLGHKALVQIQKQLNSIKKL